ncbi:MAG: glycosyltransferase family 2 protein [Lachnospiraceae bacterium]|nr:glycosyltransferase family 2 protein [Lachnospiraceae bacterium]
MDRIAEKITVVIPNFNGAAELTGCVESVLRELPASAVIVVDDGSTDDSAEHLTQAHPDVRLIKNGRNEGFAHAVNRGIREADTPYVFLLNNDARIQPGALHTLLQTMEETGGRTFSVGAKMLTRTEPRRIDNCGDLYCVLGWAFTPGKDADAGWYSHRAAVTSACAGAALYRREELLQLGGFDEAHFCYLEDVDLGIRARLHGYRNLYEPRALVLHTGSATSGSRHNAFKVRLTAGNNLYLLRKNFPAGVLLLHLPQLAAGVIIKGIYFGRKGLGKAYLAGLREGIAKIRAGRDRQIRPADAGQWMHLFRLVFEMHINLIRRAVG